MVHDVDELCPESISIPDWPGTGLSPQEVAASLSAEAPDLWEVERAIDPSGDVSIIILPVTDDAAMPTFMLYEKHGHPRVATIWRDVWQSEQVFPSCLQAVAAIVAATAALAGAA